MSFFGERVGMPVKSAPLKTVDLWDVAADSFEGQGIAWLLGYAGSALPDEIWMKGQIRFQKLQVLHHLPAFLFLAAKTGPSTCHCLFHGDGDCFLLCIGSSFLSCCGSCAFVDELVEILVELAFVFEAECDVLSSRMDLIDGQNLPASNQLLYSLCFGMRMWCLILCCLQKTGKVSVALLRTSLEMLQFISCFLGGVFLR